MVQKCIRVFEVQRGSQIPFGQQLAIDGSLLTLDNSVTSLCQPCEVLKTSSFSPLLGPISGQMVASGSVPGTSSSQKFVLGISCAETNTMYE